ncbi:MAG: hypothetical protein ABI591_19315, partial [Kofleriaceae bacterium]
EVIPVDLDALLVRRDFKADKKIAMGDTLVIPPAQFSVLVEGAVRRPGLYTYNPTFGFDQYIARAGGRTRLARDLDETTLVDANGFAHGYGSNTKPAPGDAILVPERTFSSPEVVQIIIACAGLVISGVAISIAASR